MIYLKDDDVEMIEDSKSQVNIITTEISFFYFVIFQFGLESDVEYEKEKEKKRNDEENKKLKEEKLENFISGILEKYNIANSPLSVLFFFDLKYIL